MIPEIWDFYLFLVQRFFLSENVRPRPHAEFYCGFFFGFFLLRGVCSILQHVAYFPFCHGYNCNNVGSGASYDQKNQKSQLRSSLALLLGSPLWLSSMALWLCSLALSWRSSEAQKSHLWPSWALLGRTWGHLGASWRRPERVLRRLAAS